MPDYILLTLTEPNSGKHLDVQLPSYVRLETFAPILLERLNWLDGQDKEDHKKFVFEYWLEINQGNLIVEGEQTLSAVGVLSGQLAYLKYKRTDQEKSDPSQILGPALVNRWAIYDLTGKGPDVTIGRLDPESGYTLDRVQVDLSSLDKHNSVSREHAKIFFRHATFWIEDRKSLNGTWLNGKRVIREFPQRLTNDCRVQFGDVSFIFRWAS